MRHRPSVAVLSISVVLAFLAAACTYSEVNGHVVPVVRGVGAEARFRALADVAPCLEEAEADATVVTCGYFFDEGFAVSEVGVSAAAEVVAQFVLILQVPDTVTGVEGSYTYDGVPGALSVTTTDQVDVDSQTTMSAEPGHQLVVLEMDEATHEAINAVDEGQQGVSLDRQLSFRLPELAPVTVTPMYALRADLAGHGYYIPMLPCSTDLPSASEFEIPVSDEPVDLLPAIEAAIAEAEPCDRRDVDLDVVNIVDRIAGADRIATAIEVSRAAHPEEGQAGAVLLARADAFPDALAGGPLAAARRGPLLLTATADLDARVAEELQRVLAPGGTVTILGGEAAVSEEAATAVEALGYAVDRVGGANRFETATLIADRLSPAAGPVHLADGGTFQAALLAGAAAAGTGGVVLLTAGPTMPAETAEWMAGHPSSDVLAIGDPAVEAAPDAEPVTGASPSALSVAVASRVWPDGPAEVFLASASVFADGLTGGPLAAVPTAPPWTAGGPLLLTAADRLDPLVRGYLASVADGVERIGAFGGTAALAEDVLIGASAALGG